MLTGIRQKALVALGCLLSVAGQAGMDARGEIVGQGDVAAQVVQFYKNICGVFSSTGTSFGNVVQFIAYLTGSHLLKPFLEERTKIVDGLYPHGDYQPSNC